MNYFQAFPINSHYQFGNEIDANQAGTSARLSGNYLPEVNQAIASRAPGFVDFGQLFSPARDMAEGEAMGHTASGLGTEAAAGELVIPYTGNPRDNRISWFLKNINVAIIAAILLGFGLYFFVRSGIGSQVAAIAEGAVKE